MLRYSVKPRTRKYVKAYGFLSFARNRLTNVEKKLLDTAAKTELDAAKAASKKEVHKTAEVKRQLIENKY